jgi:hypothetical protein
MSVLLPAALVYAAAAILLAHRFVALLAAILELRNDWQQRPR